MFYIGMDITKHKHEASIISSDGKPLCESISFSNTQKGCEKLIALMQTFTITADNCIIGMEATGHYWLSIYFYLLELGYNLKVINPIQSDSFRKMYIRQTKNDSKDSFVIAQLCVSVSFHQLLCQAKTLWHYASFQDTECFLSTNVRTTNAR